MDTTKLFNDAVALSKLQKQYLGDSVYADYDGYNIVLTTENGYAPSNTIALEPIVYEALAKYVANKLGIGHKAPLE